MKSFDSDLQKHAQKIRLKAAERRELRERVLSYMEYHPLPKTKETTFVETIRSDAYRTVRLNTIYTRVFSGAFAVLILAIIPFAAERSVPGDALYPIKTQFNENIRLSLANSPYKRVALETELIERRISEARLLASEGKLTEEVENALAEEVKEHAEAAQEGIEELRSEDAEEAAIAEITFDSALGVQSAVLDTNPNESATSSTETIATVVREAQDIVSENQEESTPSFGALMARVEFETTRAYELLESINGSATREERTDINRRLEDIDRKIAGAQESESVEEGTGVDPLIEALGLIQKLVLFMTDIDVRESVALDTLVPVELTDEERLLAAETLLADMRNLKTITERRVENIENESVLEKVLFGLGKLDVLEESATTSKELGDIGSLEETVAEAYALALDLDKLTNDVPLPELIDPEVEEGETEEGEASEDTEESEGSEADPEDSESTEEGDEIEAVEETIEEEATDAGEEAEAETESTEEEAAEETTEEIVE